MLFCGRGGETICEKLATSLLFHHGINLITIFHVQLVGGVVGLDTITIVQETNGIEGDTETVAVRIHQLAKLGGLLDLEENFVSVGALQFRSFLVRW
jgi:hypothetical protein